MAKLGYTWYPKDWGNSESVFELNLSERGLYRELIDLAMLNDNKTEVKKDVWSRKFCVTIEDITKIIEKLRSLNLIQIHNATLFIPSCESRLNLVRGGSKGGTKSKPTLKPKAKPLESLEENNEKPTSNQIEKESKINNIDKKLLSEIEISEVDISLLHYARTAKEFQRLFIENLEEKNASTVHQKNAKFGTYVTPIRLIIENKEGTIQDLRDVFSYLASPEGEFWKSNILSTAKLREQLPKLLMSARQVKPKQKPKEDKL